LLYIYIHIRFSTEWINDTRYRTEDGIIDDGPDKRGNLSQEQVDVLLGIHTRDRCLADRPSDTDIDFLVECYQKKSKLTINSVHYIL